MVGCMHILPVLIYVLVICGDINVQMLAVSKSPSLLRTVPRVPGNISILGIKLSDQIRKTYCLTVMIPDFVRILYLWFNLASTLPTNWTSSDLPTYVQLLLTYLVESKATLKVFLKKCMSVHLGPIVRYEWVL